MTSLSPPVLIDGVMIWSQPGRSISWRSGRAGNERRGDMITSWKISSAVTGTPGCASAGC
jgi:hypothetical protein